MPEYTLPEIKQLTSKGRRRVVVLVNRHAFSLEYVGPIQVFGEANWMLENSGRDEGYDIEVVATEPGTVYEVKGLEVTASQPYHALTGEVDTLMIQAVDQDERVLGDERLLQWVREMAGKVRRIASVCVGTYVLAESGVLDGRRATTHWAACRDFRTRYPKIHLKEDPIYVQDGNVYTSAGASCGLDLALAMVEEDFGTELARRVAQGLVMYMKRPGTQAQFSVPVQSEFPEDSRMTELQAYISENLDEDLSVESLAKQIGMSSRNFSRAFTREIGVSPGRYVEQVRLERARQALEQTRSPLSRIAQWCGYRTSNGLRLAFERQFGVTPREYRNRFSTILETSRRFSPAS
jgi:transcriptional regulator GlxA family with amidase domain